MCNFVINEFNPTSDFQNMGNGAYQNTPFANGRFPNGGYNFLWALSPITAAAAYPIIQAIRNPYFEDGLRMGTTVEVITDDSYSIWYPH